ncbi:hypothetical protein L195_g052847 [Trifolium pratense]|uniref:Uncharacterized protein n=1 Tax=Trifolium pratense TaxID=57577 RepID=A0A2K3K7C7_TRIPR|nr:hypothetical protein L195_g052847 [Trifolium pratense]
MNLKEEEEEEKDESVMMMMMMKMKMKMKWWIVALTMMLNHGVFLTASPWLKIEEDGVS